MSWASIYTACRIVYSFNTATFFRIWSVCSNNYNRDNSHRIHHIDNYDYFYNYNQYDT